MFKIAIFVEGQTELIFVREMLLKIFNWEKLALRCFNLPRDHAFQDAPYHYGEEESAIYAFYLYNTQTDARVLSAILHHEELLWNGNFHLIFGLRDMFSERYKKDVQTGTIDLSIHERFITGHRQTIADHAKQPDKIFFFFAIMEIEAWILGLRADLTHLDARLTNLYIQEQLGFDLAKIDPETYFFHPTTKGLKAIHQLVELDYDKHEQEINRLLSPISADDFYQLANSPRCASFGAFFHALYLHPSIRDAVEYLLQGEKDSQLIADTTGLNMEQIASLQQLLLPPK